MDAKLARCPVVLEIPIAWGEMDSLNHINGVVYFRYFESARFVYFQKIGWVPRLENDGTGPILASIQCTYKAPLTYPDTISVGTRADRVEADRFTMLYYLYSGKLQRIAAEGESLIVSYDYRQLQKAALPQDVRQRIEVLEAST